MKREKNRIHALNYYHLMHRRSSSTNALDDYYLPLETSIRRHRKKRENTTYLTWKQLKSELLENHGTIQRTHFCFELEHNKNKINMKQK